MHDLLEASGEFEPVLAELEQRHEVRCLDSVHLWLVHRPAVDPVLREPPPVRLEARPHPHLLA